jgi:hypothetical protein
MKKKSWALKQFLSDEATESGSIVCTVRQPKEEGGWVSASLLVRDCYKEPVELEFGWYLGKKKQKAKRIKKINLLIESLEKFKAALEETK